MSNLTKLFRLLEVSRAQPQYGYIFSGIPKTELSDLAQHHYLVTMMAWQLARLCIAQGSTLDLAKTLEISLMHDLGELFGGDICKPYGLRNPAALAAAKAFEAENLKYLATQFGNNEDHIHNLTPEIMQPSTPEGLVAKIADYVEVTHYKLYVGKLTEGDIVMSVNHISKLLERMSDVKAKKALHIFVKEWEDDLRNHSSEEIFESDKK
jgi:5'-deoxynucleotidase YfbR-like HD superfamily hydrolase